MNTKIVIAVFALAVLIFTGAFLELLKGNPTKKERKGAIIMMFLSGSFVLFFLYLVFKTINKL